MRPSVSSQRFRMTRQSRIAIIFVISGSVLVASVAVLCAMAMATTRIHQQVLRYREAIDQVEQMLSTLKDAETGQRGYLLTGDDTYLEPFSDAVKNIDGQLAALSAQAKAGTLPGEDVAEI